jgi:hypothetical protein
MSGNKKRILIVEGPAGSGKTTVAEYLSLSLQIELVKSSLPNRDPMAYSAIIDSSSNDYSKLANAMYSPYSGIVIDRLFLSQIVYHALRTEVLSLAEHELQFPTNLVPPKGLVGLWFDRVASTIATDLSVRGWAPSDHDLEVKWLVILPTAEEIQDRRHFSTREFRWEPYQELSWYTDIAKSELFFPNRANLHSTGGLDDLHTMEQLASWMEFED